MRHGYRALPVIAFSSLFGVGCSSVIVHDYVFQAEGLVLNSSGQPLPGVRVSVEVTATLYEGVTPVHQSVETTNEAGQFTFFSLTHAKNPLYTLLFEKTGYKTVVIEGAVREMNPHRVVMVQQ